MRYWDFIKRKMKYSDSNNSIILTARDIWNNGYALADVWDSNGSVTKILSYGNTVAGYNGESVYFGFPYEKTLDGTVSTQYDRYIIKLGSGIDISKYKYTCMFYLYNMEWGGDRVYMNFTTTGGTYPGYEHKLFHNEPVTNGNIHKMMISIDQRFGEGTIATSLYGPVIMPPGTTLPAGSLHIFAVGFFKNKKEAENFSI